MQHIHTSPCPDVPAVVVTESRVVNRKRGAASNVRGEEVIFAFLSRQ